PAARVRLPQHQPHVGSGCCAPQGGRGEGRRTESRPHVIDVTATETIPASRDEVARYVMDHRNDPAWIGGISESELLGKGPLDIGSDVRRVASFLGKRVEYVNRFEELEPGRRLVVRWVKSPCPMVVTARF